MWLVDGRSLDHTTICKFRTRFRKPLKDLFRQIRGFLVQGLRGFGVGPGF
jgi:hypothetical protein